MRREKLGALAILSDDVINKIAAGEVIERPSSIVRELVDNALDAGASSLQINILEGGQGLIRVRDNGLGMSAEDAQLCFQRHATSKIASIKDLEAISSLGFRGEALSSIAAVAQVRLRTRREADEHGTEVVAYEGRILSVKACAFAQGSEFEVSRLFANLPARKKFLKSPRADSAKIQDWLQYSALAHPEISYRLNSDGKDVLQLASQPSVFDRAESMLQGSSIRVDFQAGPIKIRGLVAHPSQVDFKLGALAFVVNHRPVQDRMLMRAVRDAWSAALRGGESPVGVLDITLPNSEVDVNVHPQKSEVRFRNSQAVFGSVYKAIKSALLEWKPELPEFNRTITGINVRGVADSPSQPSQYARTSIFTNETAAAQPDRLPKLIETERYIGQVLGVYLLFERDAGLLLVDAHAAHERIRFNHLMRWAEQKSSSSQKFLIPHVVSFSELQCANLAEKTSALEEWGIYFKVDTDSVSIQEAPSEWNISELVSLLKSLSELESNEVDSLLQKAIEHSLARSACRSSVMSGMRLSESEAYQLWHQIKSEPQGAVCPHGRPVSVTLTREKIDSLFFRDGF